jgi:Flp pilus assembly protein TadD
MHDRMTEALPHLERAVELQPDDAEMRHALGRALLAFGRTAAATAQFQEALLLNPNHAGAHEALNLLRRSGAPPR